MDAGGGGKLHAEFHAGDREVMLPDEVIHPGRPFEDEPEAGAGVSQRTGDVDYVAGTCGIALQGLPVGAFAQKGDVYEEFVVGR